MTSLTPSDRLEAFEMPEFMNGVPLAFDWCMYNGEVMFASLNYSESEKRGKAVFDLAYCATKAHNEIFLKQRVWNKKIFQPWEGHSSWCIAECEKLIKKETI